MSVKRNPIIVTLVITVLATLAGCGSPDVKTMKAGLVRSGIPESQAACFAEKMSETVDSESYNYMAALLNEGVSESNAANRTRRKFGGDFRTGMKAARAACVD